MNDLERKRREIKSRKTKVWLVVGVVVLILLLLFWVDIADMFGAGDGAAMIAPLGLF